MENLKKILLVSSYAPPAIGGPQNLYNLFRDFPSSRYFILTSYYNIDNLSAKAGVWLPTEYFFYDNFPENKESRQHAARENSPAAKRSLYIQKLKFFMKRIGIVRTLGGLPVILSQIIAIVINGRRVIKSKKIEILLGFSDYGPAMIGTYILHKITKAPYSIFLFDLYKGNFLPFPGELIANLFEKTILLSADKIIVTNQGTKDLYTQRYGERVKDRIIIIPNSVFPETYTSENLNSSSNERKTILFTGRIYWPQIEALKNMIRAVNELEDDIEFHIYSPSPKEYLWEIGIFESEKVKLRMAAPKDIPFIQKNSDILFLPLSWNTQSQAIIDTATPGKLTDYLIAGRPILIHAPSSSFLVKYAKERKFAEVIDINNVEKLKTSILKILGDSIYAKMLTENAKKTFFENHDANINSVKIKNLFLKN